MLRGPLWFLSVGWPRPPRYGQTIVTFLGQGVTPPRPSQWQGGDQMRIGTVRVLSKEKKSAFAGPGGGALRRRGGSKLRRQLKASGNTKGGGGWNARGSRGPPPAPWGRDWLSRPGPAPTLRPGPSRVKPGPAFPPLPAFARPPRALLRGPRAHWARRGAAGEPAWSGFLGRQLARAAAAGPPWGLGRRGRERGPGMASKGLPGRRPRSQAAQSRPGLLAAASAAGGRQARCVRRRIRGSAAAVAAAAPGPGRGSLQFLARIQLAGEVGGRLGVLSAAPCSARWLGDCGDAAPPGSGAPRRAGCSAAPTPAPRAAPPPAAAPRWPLLAPLAATPAREHLLSSSRDASSG